MQKSTKVLSALAIGGLIAASSAFTAGGITTTNSSGFVGGSVSQSITGANLASVVYDTDEATNKITTVTLNFTGTNADGKTPTMAFTGATVNGTYVCAAVATGASLCTGGPAADNNVTTLTVTVA